MHGEGAVTYIWYQEKKGQEPGRRKGERKKTKEKQKNKENIKHGQRAEAHKIARRGEEGQGRMGWEGVESSDVRWLAFLNKRGALLVEK